MMETGEIIYEKVYASPRLPKISYKDNWMKELDSEVAGGGKDSQQIQPKTNNSILRTLRPVLSEQQSSSSVQEIEKRCLVWLRKHQRKHGETCEELCASVC